MHSRLAWQWWQAKHSGWNLAFNDVVADPEAVTTRPEIGSPQLEQDTDGTPGKPCLSHGNLLLGDVRAGAVAACFGRGRAGGFAALSSGPEMEKDGADTLMFGASHLSTCIAGTLSSGRLIVGIAGAVLIASEVDGSGLGRGLCMSLLVRGDSVSLMTGLDTS